jgi:hypothetical protein
MIEIRTFDGTPDELAAFCTGFWRDRYGGKMAMPLWGGPLLDWMFFSDDPAVPNLLVAAYDGTRLVGTLPELAVQYHLHGQPIPGSFGSFFTIDPAYENQGVSLKMVLEQRRRHRELKAQLSGGYLIRGEAVSMGQQFWMRLRDMYVVMSAGLWVRLIDHRVMSDFLFHPFEKYGSRFLGLLQPRPTKASAAAGIRPYRESDLPDCLRLANETSRMADFGIVWDERSLGRQLNYKGFPRTIVAEHNGRVAGFVNYFLQEYLGQREMLAGVIDLLSVHALPFSMQKGLLRVALSQMVSEGCHSSLFLRVGGQPAYLLSRMGFLPEAAHYDYALQSMAPDAPRVKTRRIHALWR